MAKRKPTARRTHISDPFPNRAALGFGFRDAWEIKWPPRPNVVSKSYYALTYEDSDDITIITAAKRIPVQQSVYDAIIQDVRAAIAAAKA